MMDVYSIRRLKNSEGKEIVEIVFQNFIKAKRINFRIAAQRYLKQNFYAENKSIKKQQESIADKLVEGGASAEDESTLTTQKIGKQVKADYLQIAQKYAAYQKECSLVPEPTVKSDALEAMTSAVTKMADVLESKPNTSGLERLSVPSWDGSRRSYATWKKEFNHWMSKYRQDDEEQLQRFRKAMPKGSWWTDQVKTCKSIDQAWSILDVEFEDKRKLMDSLLAEINNYKPVKKDSKSLT
ncbi:hypothetical protein QZH41_005627 [Actinostola sp. cb2023]|nr:hypothetical protein QZH41_005627 [Actinostola sp. cb2023]